MRKGNDAFVQGGESCSEAKGEAGRTKSEDEGKWYNGRLGRIDGNSTATGGWIDMDELIEQRRKAILAIAERHGVTNVRVFGSMARGTADEESDVDLLVRPLPGTSLLDLGGLVMDAQELLGRPVDVVSERALHPAMREQVLREALPL